MKIKALKTFSNAHTGNVTVGDVFECNNDDLIQHLLEHKMIEPVGKQAYQNKMLNENVKKKGPQDLSGSESGKGKQSSASPAAPASPPDKSSTSESDNPPESAGSSPSTPATDPQNSQMSSMDAMEPGGDTSPEDAKSPPGKMSPKTPKRKRTRRTKPQPSD